jgi:uroporphyrinogen decarboxylase
MSTETMTPKERLMTATRGGIPDTVPVQVGTYEMIPAKLTGLPWWDIFLYNKVKLWQKRIELTKFLQYDGYIYGALDSQPGPDDLRTYDYAIVRQDDEYIVQRTTVHTPDGDLWQERTYPRDNSATVTRGYIKDERDFALYLKYFFPKQTKYRWDTIDEIKVALGDAGALGGMIGLPGLHELTDLVDGRLEKATYLCMDYPELAEEYCAKRKEQLVREIDILLDAKPDYIQIGASGLLTLSNPHYFRQLSLPALKEMTARCKQADIPSELHCCGKERYIVEVCANETDLDAINPLQPPPMGDCDLAEIKQTFGSRLCLKGNVGVTEPMLLGTPEDVERDVVRCMDAAKRGGGYILFTEEQLGRDTPFENIHAMIAAARRYGKY